MSQTHPPRWREFLTVRVVARWTDESADDEWEIRPGLIASPAGERMIVSGRLRLTEGAREVTVVTALTSEPLTDAEATTLRDATAQTDVARVVNSVVHDRAYSIALSAAALIEMTLPRRVGAPEPVITPMGTP